MNNFTQRLITGFLLVAVLVTAISLHHISFLILFFLLNFFGLIEFYKLAGKMEGVYPQKTFSVISGSLIFILISLFSLDLLQGKWLTFIIAFLFLPFLFELFRTKPKPFENIAVSMLGLIYISGSFSLLTLLVKPNQFLPYMPGLLLGFFILLWTQDTGAYIAGKSFGKRLLFERISPKKTWEGAIGAFVLTFAASYFLMIYFPVLTYLQWAVTGVIIWITGSLGDLAESMFKRSINVKDSGSILPGHGGILDRFDSLLISCPFVFIYFYFQFN